MKLASMFAMTIAAAASWQDMAASGELVRSLGASPEALIIGGGLLMIASLLRYQLTSQQK
jgi:hypothetical protein